MTSAESLERYGTVTFGIDFMRQTIGPPYPGDRTLDATRWIASVPEVYRDDVIKVACGAAEEFLAEGRMMHDRDITALIHTMHAAVIRHVQPR